MSGRKAPSPAPAGERPTPPPAPPKPRTPVVRLIYDLERSLRECRSAIGDELNANDADEIAQHPILLDHEAVHGRAGVVLARARAYLDRREVEPDPPK